MYLLQDKNAKELCYDKFYTRFKILNSEILLTESNVIASTIASAREVFQKC